MDADSYLGRRSSQEGTVPNWRRDMSEFLEEAKEVEMVPHCMTAADIAATGYLM